MKLTELIEKRIDENVASYDLGTLESYKYLIEMIAIEYHNEQLRLYNVSNRYFVFSGQEDGKPTKYLVDDCIDRETAIAKIETEYPNFKWVMTETFNGC